MSSLIGQRLGQYEIVALLGKGGMATVYRAQQTSMGRDVAIKVIKPDLVETGDFVIRFEREARTVAGLSHPHILKVFDYGHHGDLVYLVMELLKGGSLADLVGSGALAPEVAGRILDQIASALDYAHEHGIIHRDLKSQNVLLDDKKNALLTDFGIAKLLGQTTALTQSGAAMGTPAYMSPEQWQGVPIDARADIYSLGVMLFEMLAGQLPFRAETPYSMMHMHITVPPPMIYELRDNLPPGIDKVIAKTLAKDRDQRYSTAGEVSADYKAVLTGQLKSATAETLPALQPKKGIAPIDKSSEGAGMNTFVPTPTRGKVTKTPEQPRSVSQTVQPWRNVEKDSTMTGTNLDLVFNYLAILISEREPDKPFMLSQLQTAITYKFPNFNFADYKLAGLKDFIVMGEKAGYFKLSDPGSMQTAYLAPGSKQPTQSLPQTGALENLPENDPRRMRWMQLALENMLTADRADQIFDAIKGLDALTPAFDSFLGAQGKTAQQYPVRGKIQRIRNFLKTYREQGEAAARSSWQISRTLARMPSIPPLQNAAGAESLIWGIMQGNTLLENVPLDKLNNLFFAVLIFSRNEMARNRSFDWVAGLEMLEADARAIPRPVPSQKRGLFGGGKTPESSHDLDDFEIAVLVEDLRKAAGIRASMTDQTGIWKVYLDAASPNASLQFLTDHPALLEDDGLLTWLEEQIGENVAAGKLDVVKSLATKSAIVIIARQRKAGQPPDDLRTLHDSIMEGATLLGAVFGYLSTNSTANAGAYLHEHQELLDPDGVGPLIEDQAKKAAGHSDRERYRRISERLDLWRNVIEFGDENGLQQHQRFLARERTDAGIEAEMGLMILVEAETVDDRRDALERYPAVGSVEGLALVDGMLDMLSFQNNTDQYNRYHTIKRLIERCLEVGVDRALSELR